MSKKTEYALRATAIALLLMFVLAFFAVAIYVGLHLAYMFIVWEVVPLNNVLLRMFVACGTLLGVANILTNDFRRNFVDVTYENKN